MSPEVIESRMLCPAFGVMSPQVVSSLLKLRESDLPPQPSFRGTIFLDEIAFDDKSCALRGNPSKLRKQPGNSWRADPTIGCDCTVLFDALVSGN